MVLALYTPIDLPAMEYNREEFINWHESERTRNGLLPCDKNESEGFIPPWMVSHAFRKEYGWNDSLLKVIPNLKNIAENHLPYTDIIYINFIEQKIHCQPHFDKATRPAKEDEPGTYKAFMVYDKPLMYFQYERAVEDKIYIKHPNELTKWFAINNHDALHAGDLPEPPDRKIIMTIFGKLDKEKHQEILKRSFKKYKDYIIN